MMPLRSASGASDQPGYAELRVCPFCSRFAEKFYATDHEDRVDDSGCCAVFEPLNPVTPGHLLVVPFQHIEDALAAPAVTGHVMAFAASVAERDCNLITSVGSAATQTVRHLHVHIVPRREGDGLTLPWTGQEVPNGE